MTYVSLAQTSTSVAIAVGICALLAAVVAHVRWVRPKWRRSKEMFVAGRDSLIGRPAIVDTITGKEISPALPGIGNRMENVEQNQIETRDALRHIATVMEGQQVQDGRIQRLEDDVRELKAAAVERAMARVESASAWRAVEAVANGAHEPDESAELD